MRRHLVHFLLVTVFTVCSATAALAQVTVKGQVVDADSNEPMIGAAVTVVGTQQGVVTDLDGNFTLNAAANATVSITYLGYKEAKKKVTVKGGTGRGTVDLGVILLEVDAFALDDVTITSSIAVARKTPVAVSSVSPVYIEERLGTQEFPEILKMTPGVYVTKKGGGFGDSEIRMRGFKSENIAVMVNGVPMNDMEWGGVYWSNWAGLSDITRSKQTQRGLGASKVAAPSVGGSINIVTKSIETKKGGDISYAVGNDGLNKLLFSVSTGMTDDGWAVNVVAGKSWGNGYIQGTEFEGYNYYLNIAKRINDNHQLSFSAFGAPQWHNQRNKNDGLTIEGWQQVKNYMGEKKLAAYKYNPSYGFGRNGERKVSAYNEYHKPQISLNHLWQIDDKSSLSTALYVSIGGGGGYSGQGLTSDYRNKWYGASYGTLNTAFRNSDGTFAYDQIYDINEASEEGSLMAMSNSINNHRWYGLLSTYTTKIGEHIDVYGGIDFRYYKGIHKNKLVDLYGGKYFVDSSSRSGVLAANNSAALLGDAYVNEKLQVGDIVYRDYDGYVVQGGIFGQAEYNLDKLSAFVSGSVSNSSTWRYDRFYYDKDHARSETMNDIGFTVKGGANYNLTDNHNVFANVGYISRAPFFSGGVFLSSTVSNMTNPDAVNEKIFSLELGYGYRSKFFSADVNVYHTEWLDKTMTRGIDVKDGTTNTYVDRIGLNMSGVDATHEGVELELTTKPFDWLQVRGMFSIGDWRWTSTAKGYFYDSAGQPVKSYGRNPDTGVTEIVHASGIQAEDHASMTVDLDGVKVGGSAQTTAAIGVDIYPLKGLRLGADYLFYGRNYSDWNFSSSDLVLNGFKKYETPWRIPSAHTFDLNASYKFKIAGLDATIFGNLNNVFNQEYIIDANDGANHDWKTAYGVFYAFGRTGSVRLKIEF